MLSNLGNILLFVSTFITLSIIYIAYQNIKEKNFLIRKNLVYLSFFQITFIITSFLLLIFAFVFSDFSLLAVYQNSHTAKPIFYKIAGVWGNHEGSLLLWVNIMVIFSFLFCWIESFFTIPPTLIIEFPSIELFIKISDVVLKYNMFCLRLR